MDPIALTIPTHPTRPAGARLPAGGFASDLEALLAQAGDLAAGIAALISGPGAALTAGGTVAVAGTAEGENPVPGQAGEGDAAGFQPADAARSHASAHAAFLRLSLASSVGGADPTTMPGEASAGAAPTDGEPPAPPGAGAPAGFHSPAGAPEGAAAPANPSAQPGQPAGPALAHASGNAAFLREGTTLPNGSPAAATPGAGPGSVEPVASGQPAPTGSTPTHLAGGPGGPSAAPGDPLPPAAGPIGAGLASSPAPAASPDPLADLAPGGGDSGLAGAGPAGTGLDAAGSTASTGAPGSPATGATPAEPVPATEVPARLLEAARAARHQDGHVERLVIRLDPPDLGAVRVEVLARGGEVHVLLRAETPEARAALQAQRQNIEDLFGGQGFELGHFDIDHQDRGHEQRPGRRAGTAGNPSPEPDPLPAEPPAADTALRL